MKMNFSSSLLEPRIAVVILTAALALSGCQDETPTSCPDYAVGALEGYLLSVGQGVSLDIEARAVNQGSWGEVVASTTSDATGWYHFDLPSGLYRLEVRSADDYFFTYEPGDTVRVRQAVRRYDLWRGRIEVQVGMPDEFEGQNCDLRLQGDSRSYGVQATVQSGQLLFVFPFESLGSNKMQLSVRDQGLFYLPGTYSRSEGYSLIVGLDEVARYEVDFSDLYASISGRVTGSWQEAQSSTMKVSLHGESANSYISRVNCEPDGSYTCGVLIPGPVKIKTSFAYDFIQWIGGDSFETAQIFDVQPGDHLHDANLVESGIAVHIEWPGDLIGSKPWLTMSHQGVEVEEMYPPGYNPYFLCNLRPGRHYVKVEWDCQDQEWAPRWFGETENFGDAEPIDLVAGELREISINLLEGGRIEGEFQDQDGHIFPEARYQIYDTDGVPLCMNWQHWRGSRMLFSGLPDGTYVVAGRTSGYPNSYYPGTFDIEQATRIVIEGHQTVAGLVWTLPEVVKGGSP